MRILGIETSCDETGAAIVEDGTKVLANIVASSQELHIKTGGIIPEVAAREQIKCIIPVIEEALQNLHLEGVDKRHLPGGRMDSWKVDRFIDAIAVTVGPGLIGSLLVGVETAKTLASIWGKPIIPVNHLISHIYANWLGPKPYTLNPKPSFPAIVLIASGGHTDLLLMKGHGKLRRLGGTRDDAAGECFDKCARILGLSFPGGPAIAAEATKLKVKSEKLKVKLPRPMIESDNFDFSFSGLKTALLREVNQLKGVQQFNNLTVQQLSSSVQEAITDVLVEKTIRAAQKYQVKSILISGGVAANDVLREKFRVQSSEFRVNFFAPAKNLCTDNAAMVAAAAFFNYSPKPWPKIQAHPELFFTNLRG